MPTARKLAEVAYSRGYRIEGYYSPVTEVKLLSNSKTTTVARFLKVKNAVFKMSCYGHNRRVEVAQLYQVQCIKKSKPTQKEESMHASAKVSTNAAQAAYTKGYRVSPDGLSILAPNGDVACHFSGSEVGKFDKETISFTNEGRLEKVFAYELWELSQAIRTQHILDMVTISTDKKFSKAPQTEESVTAIVEAKDSVEIIAEIYDCTPEYIHKVKQIPAQPARAVSIQDLAPELAAAPRKEAVVATALKSALKRAGKLSSEAIIDIYTSMDSNDAAAEKYGVSASLVSMIRSRKVHAAVTVGLVCQVHPKGSRSARTMAEVDAIYLDFLRGATKAELMKRYWGFGCDNIGQSGAYRCINQILKGEPMYPADPGTHPYVSKYFGKQLKDIQTAPTVVPQAKVEAARFTATVSSAVALATAPVKLTAGDELIALNAREAMLETQLQQKIVAKRKRIEELEALLK